ncbi:DMT family transporter [Sedimentibacter hydroxybenzoicus DSM 7310]|uniref:DMT family transporter n=1 Tax=Sedimentibacter hydroxybenzoicus DSM 7310 TaxID=1123245 RepID=A0A974BK34_SEDHY|nr:DMT family transporter [Sedimentibacter hydroxybenzoicus]NYB74744.1 DMT family transporter [Sedimentibacter hydroxybenzoicus DSM 7310]
MTKQIKADMMLLLVTLGWGVSYLLVDISLEDMGSFTLNANRFLIAFAVAVALSYRKLRNISKETLKYSIILGFLLVFVYIGANLGVQYTTLSNTGFLCGLSVVFTPILSSVIYKKAPDKKLSIVIIMSFVGIALLTLKDNFAINSENLFGDSMSIMCAFVYSIDLLITERAVKKEEVNPFQLGILQLGVTGTLNLLLAFIFEKPNFPTTPNIWASVLFLSIFCTGLAFIIQAVAQQYTSASHVGVIFSLETLFAGIVAYIFAREVLTLKSYIGAFLMILSLFIMEVDHRTLLKKLRIKSIKTSG